MQTATHTVELPRNQNIALTQCLEAGPICGVVSQKNQFAPGDITKRCTADQPPLAEDAALSVYEGERHPIIANATFIYAASYQAFYNKYALCPDDPDSSASSL